MSPQLPNPAMIPFLVAVTGHRDLRPQDLDHLREEVRSIFVGMRSRMPHTPILLLTGLAEGADQLVAEVALEQQALLVAAIPMPIDIYKEQMSAAAGTNLERLLALSVVRIMLPLEGRALDAIRASETVRADCYEALALFLARYGQSLIALWDGADSQKRGGTSRIVHYVRSGVLDEDVDEAELLCGVVYHVQTPRLSNAAPIPTITTVQLGCERQPAETTKATVGVSKPAHKVRFAQVEMAFERFNRVAAKSPSYKADVRSRLMAADTISLSTFQGRLERLYEQADRISLQANSRRKFVLGAILCIAIIGTLFYGVHGEILGTQLWLWLSFPLFVIAALLLHRTAKAEHVEDTYLDARALAEAVRVQFFWTIAGISEPVDRYYLADRRAELDWIRIALKNVWLLHQGQQDSDETRPRLQTVLDFWVKNQERWYRVKADRQSRSVHRRETVSKNALRLAVGWSIAVPFGVMLLSRWHGRPFWKSFGSEQQFESDWIYQSFHVALALPALLAGAYRLWIEQAGYEEQSRDYRSMQREFSLAAKELEKHINETEIAQALLLSLGIEALKENGRWMMLHRERPLEVLSSP